MSTSYSLPFADWCDLLRRDAVICGRSREVRVLGETVLELFWERGCEPTILAILDDCTEWKAA